MRFPVYPKPNFNFQVLAGPLIDENKVPQRAEAHANIVWDDQQAFEGHESPTCFMARGNIKGFSAMRFAGPA